MFEEKPDPQIFEEEKNKKEYLPKSTEMKIDGEEENLGEELRDAILVYLLSEKVIEGLQEEEKYSLLLEDEDLIIMCLDKDGKVDYAWHTEDKGIINKIKKLISE